MVVVVVVVVVVMVVVVRVVVVPVVVVEVHGVWHALHVIGQAFLITSTLLHMTSSGPEMPQHREVLSKRPQQNLSHGAINVSALPAHFAWHVDGYTVSGTRSVVST